MTLAPSKLMMFFFPYPDSSPPNNLDAMGRCMNFSFLVGFGSLCAIRAAEGSAAFIAWVFNVQVSASCFEGDKESKIL